MNAAPGAATGQSTAQFASLGRRFLALIYEALILAAVVLAGALPAVMVTQSWPPLAARTALQFWLLVLCGAFYGWQWCATGQTLPMKTWHMKLVTVDGSPLNRRRALARYLAALGGLLMLGLGFLWAFIDRDRQFLHDRLAGTRVVVSEASL